MRVLAVLAVLVLAGCFGSDPEPAAGPEPEPTPVPPQRAVTVNVPAPGQPFIATLVDLERTGHEPTVAVAPDGTIYVHARGVLHSLSSGKDGSKNYLWRSTDGGESFTRIGNEAMDNRSASEGTVAVMPDGRVLAAYSTVYLTAPGTVGNTTDRRVDIHASDDGGETWDLASSIEMPSAHRTWLWTKEGIVHLGVMSYGHTFYYWSSDGGVTWDGPHRVHDYNTYNGRMVARGQNVLWPWQTGLYEQAPGALEEEVPWVIDAHIATEPQVWVPYPVTTIEGRGSVFLGATVDEAGILYITWATWNDAGSEVAYAYSANGADWEVVTVSEGPGLRLMPWIETSGAGDVGVVWYQNDDYSGDPLTATGDWYPQYAAITNATGDADIQVIRPWNEPILSGPLCIHAFSCGDVVRGTEFCFEPLRALHDCTDLDHLRYLDDYIGLDYVRGKAVMGFVTTHGFGLPDWEAGDPGHILVIRET